VFGLFKVVLLALVLAFLGFSARLFVWPDTNAPLPADAVVVLAGSKARLTKALELMRDRVGPTLVISDGLDPYWPQAVRLCRNGSRRFRVICFRPKPYNTRGEAERVARMVRTRHWRTVDVVTSTFHITRARLLFKRCVKARVRMVAAKYPLVRLPQFVASEWVKLLYAQTIKRGC
jgi:uncharacterized SAM-binding protein YcdF (DUF218 family)